MAGIAGRRSVVGQLTVDAGVTFLGRKWFKAPIGSLQTVAGRADQTAVHDLRPTADDLRLVAEITRASTSILRSRVACEDLVQALERSRTCGMDGRGAVRVRRLQGAQ